MPRRLRREKLEISQQLFFLYIVRVCTPQCLPSTVMEWSFFPAHRPLTYYLINFIFFAFNFFILGFCAPLFFIAFFSVALLPWLVDWTVVPWVSFILLQYLITTSRSVLCWPTARQTETPAMKRWQLFRALEIMNQFFFCSSTAAFHFISFLAA